MGIQFEIPALKLESLANKREHWFAKATRAKTQRYWAERYCQSLASKVALPAAVTITRIGKRKLDSDNLAISAKHVRDGIADALGIDDGDESRVTWSYAQEIGKDYGVRVSIK